MTETEAEIIREQMIKEQAERLDELARKLKLAEEAAKAVSYPLTPKQVQKRYEVIAIARRAKQREDLLIKVNAFLVEHLRSLAHVALELDRRDVAQSVIDEVLSMFKDKGWRFTVRAQDSRTRVDFIEPLESP